MLVGEFGTAREDIDQMPRFKQKSKLHNLLARPTPLAAMVLILGTSFDTPAHQRVHMDVG